MRLLLAVEIVFVSVLVAGVAMVYVPAALILAGFLGVVAVERASAQARARDRRLRPVRGERAA